MLRPCFGLCYLYLRNVKGYRVESQAGLPDLSGVGAESADQTQKASAQGETGTAPGASNHQCRLVDGFHARSAGGWPELPAVQGH